MGELKDKLDNVNVRVQSPDRRILATLTGADAFELSFADEDAYFEYPDSKSIESQLTSVVSALMSARREAIRMTFSEYEGWKDDSQPHWDASRRRYREEVSLLHAAGSSKEGLIEIETVGQREWFISINERALNDLDSYQFCASVKSALVDLYRDYSSEVRLLKEELHGRVGVRRHMGT